MTTSQTTAFYPPRAGEKILSATLAYFRARSRHKAFSAVLDELDHSGISQAELARRLGKGPDQISRYLAGPGNWTLDTLSDFLFAISGGTVKFIVEHPLARTEDEKPESIQGAVAAAPNQPTPSKLSPEARSRLEALIKSAPPKQSSIKMQPGPAAGRFWSLPPAGQERARSATDEIGFADAA
jgi:transcriptional regulator with XRE-family HTH domain